MFLAIWACCLCLILSASSESSTRHDSASLVDALRKRLEAKETKIEKQGELIDQMQRAVTQLRDELGALKLAKLDEVSKRVEANQANESRLSQLEQQLSELDEQLAAERLKAVALEEELAKMGSNHRLASASLDNTIKVWNTNSGECLRSLTGHTLYVRALKMVAKNRLVSGSADRTLKLWNLASGECVRTFSGHSGIVRCLEALPNNRIASGAEDSSIRVWNERNGECVRIFMGHTGVITSLALVGKNLLASCSVDKTIRIWNLDK